LESNINNLHIIDEDIQGISSYMRINFSGEIIPPGGSFREKYFYVKAGKTDELCERLHNYYGDKALILKKSEFLNKIWQGLDPSANAIQSLGEVILIAQGNELFAWSSTDQPFPAWKGFHGGLSPEEMKIPLLAIAI